MANYSITIITLGLAGLLLVIQLVIADLTAIRRGHRAGYPITANSADFLFRAARAHLNTNESIAAFALLAVCGILSSASPVWVNALSAAWLLFRIGHMTSYYANIKLYRSAAFGGSLVVLIGLFVVSLTTWLQWVR